MKTYPQVFNNPSTGNQERKNGEGQAFTEANGLFPFFNTPYYYGYDLYRYIYGENAFGVKNNKKHFGKLHFLFHKMWKKIYFKIISYIISKQRKERI